MKNRISSPIGTGSGAHVIHCLLEKGLANYRVRSYNPYWTMLPFMLPIVTPLGDPDLIHALPDHARFFHRQSIPLVISFQNYVLDKWMRPHSSFIQKIHYATDLKLWTKSAVKKAQRITAVSEFTAQLVRKDLQLSAPIEIIYNGVDTDHFTPPVDKKNDSKEICVFFSGNLTLRKGAHWLPEIAKHLDSDIKIYYTQGLRTRNFLPEMLNLQSIGPVSFEDMPSRYRQMDILLMPTVREGLSLAVLEAMACGLPVVASDCSSLPEQIDEEKGGYLCPLGDIHAFAEKINLLANSAGRRKEMGDYNRAKAVKLFTLTRMVQAYRELFEEILSAT